MPLGAVYSLSDQRTKPVSPGRGRVLVFPVAAATRSRGSVVWQMLTAMVLMAILLGTGLFTLRQRRLELACGVTRLHGQMNHLRVDLWDLQTRISELSQPSKLQQAVVDAGLKLEPTVGGVKGPGLQRFAGVAPGD